jgi:hypothetical protein
MNDMPYSNFGELLAELKKALVDGITADGLVCTTGSPVYGGTETGEDFDGFNIYMISIEDYDDGSFGLTQSIPHINVDGEDYIQESFLDYEAQYQAVFRLSIVISQFNTLTIGSDTLRGNELGDYYVEKLKYLLDRFIPANVTLMERSIPEVTKHTSRDSNNEAFHTAYVFYTFGYLREIS